jgi:hypothetical protein
VSGFQKVLKGFTVISVTARRLKAPEKHPNWKMFKLFAGEGRIDA